LGIVKEPPNIFTAMAASLAHEQRLKIRQPDIIRPAVGIHHVRMGALVVAAVKRRSKW
jgi:hypothetical protein